MKKILNDYGIGMLTIHVTDEENLRFYKDNNLGLEDFVQEEWYCHAKLFRQRKEVWTPKWDRALKDMYRYENNVNGGNKGGGYNTEYRCMIRDIEYYLKKKGNAWTTIKELIENVAPIMYHYKNPKQSLYRALTTIEFKEFECSNINKKTCFRLKNYEKVTT